MSDRFDEMALKVYHAAIGHYESDINMIASFLRSTWNEAIEAAAQHFYKSSRDGCGREIRALKEPKR